MKIILYGATGMVGQGVLLECLRDPGVEQVLAVGRTPTGRTDAKLRELILKDLENYAGIEASLAGYDACFFCLGVSSAGMKEADYERITYRYTMAAAEALSHVHPGMTFIFVSGAHTDSTEKGRTMWARVKGRTENALLCLPLKAYMFRPGFIQPLDGIRSKTPAYRVLYRLIAPLVPLLKRLFPHQVVSTRDIGRAMLAVARNGYATPILEIRDIQNALPR